MESRGVNEGRPRTRPAIARRSCDQCRSRKVGCDRGSPCSNCISARLGCTHSAVTSSTSTPKQRVLISAQYEQKIDDIVKGIDGIKLLLQERDALSGGTVPEKSPVHQTVSVRPVNGHGNIDNSRSELPWDHSAHIIDFLKSVVQGSQEGPASSHTDETISSLQGLLGALETPPPSQTSILLEPTLAKETDLTMPPLEPTLAVLRWAKKRAHHFRINRLAQLLPLEKFAETCQKVYFALDGYTEVDFILANGYLSFVFSEHLLVIGQDDSRENWLLCQKNLHQAVSRLPLLLPASMDVVAALTLAAYDALENSKASEGWTFVSTAAGLCQTLGYHRAESRRGRTDDALRASQERLFWSVYNLDKGLSLRLGRSSSIRDEDITLPVDSESRATKLSRIQGKVYDYLYSPSGLSRPESERGASAEVLAQQLRELIKDIHVDMEDATRKPAHPDSDDDPLQLAYLQCFLVCHSSLLTLILRAIPSERASPSGASDECVAVAKVTMDIHEQCMSSLRACKTDPRMVTKYLNWAILNTPFVPFSVLFIHAVKTLDINELAYLDRFAASLQPGETSSESMTHPHRLYELLSKTARLYIESNGSPSTMHSVSRPVSEFDLPDLGGRGTEGNENPMQPLATIGPQAPALNDWYHNNQDLMNFLDETTTF